MKILCRADASHELGTGHVMRQLTLADALMARGDQVTFACRAHPGHLADMIKARGFACHLWPADSHGIVGADPTQDAAQTAQLAQHTKADWVFVDHYGLDAAWEAAQPAPVLAMDDMFDRPHDCAILINQNLGVTKADYDGLIPHKTTCLMGSAYALLRPEFAQLRPQAIARRAKSDGVKSLLISMGGSDQPNATGWVLDQLGQMDLPSDLHITIVMGQTAPHMAAVRTAAQALPYETTVLAGTSHMAQLMVQADLAIGAAGSTSWERCALGLPSLMMVLAENQRGIAHALEAAGAAKVFDHQDGPQFHTYITQAITQPQNLAQMAQNSLKIIDGDGAHRVVDALCNSQDSF